MDACTPKHLCIRVPGQESAIRYGFAASLAPGLNASKGLGLIVQAENLQQADSLLTLSSYNEDSSPGQIQTVVAQHVGFHSAVVGLDALQRTPGSIPKAIAQCSSVTFGLYERSAMDICFASCKGRLHY